MVSYGVCICIFNQCIHTIYLITIAIIPRVQIPLDIVASFNSRFYLILPGNITGEKNKLPCAYQLLESHVILQIKILY